jgi:hypothetical protein
VTYTSSICRRCIHDDDHDNAWSWSTCILLYMLICWFSRSLIFANWNTLGTSATNLNGTFIYIVYLLYIMYIIYKFALKMQFKRPMKFFIFVFNRFFPYLIPIDYMTKKYEWHKNFLLFLKIFFSTFVKGSPLYKKKFFSLDHWTLKLHKCLNFTPTNIISGCRGRVKYLC